MISTVTTSTVSTVTTVALAGSLAVVGVSMLLVLLIQKELTTVSKERFAQALGRALNIGIVPLLIGFILIVVVQIAAVLR
jgi:hypothetical protein